MIGTWGHAGVRCKIKSGWDNAGQEGEAICYFVPNRPQTQDWIVVVWDNEDDPCLHKASGLLFYDPEEEKWQNFK